MTQAAQIYGELLAQPRNLKGRAYRAFYANGHLKLRAFLEGESSLPGLIIQIPRDRVPASFQLPRIRGAALTIGTNGEGKHLEVVYEFIAAGNSYSEVFIELASTLIDQICTCDDEAEALGLVALRLAAWARFFNARGTEALARSEELGLIGELLCMKTLASLVTFPIAVSSWTGPSRTTPHHDFQCKAGAIEVKLTTSATPERIKISSLRQLDESALPFLALYVIVAQETFSGDVSLAGLIRELRSTILICAPAALQLLDDRILAAGYIESDSDHYKIRLAVRDSAFYRVADTFPRIRPIDISTQIFSVSYEIAVSSLLPFKINNQAIFEVFSV